MVARRAHNPQVGGSNPAPAPNFRWMVDYIVLWRKPSRINSGVRTCVVKAMMRLDTYSQQKAPI
jgi:hypothetical protein